MFHDAEDMKTCLCELDFWDMLYLNLWKASNNHWLFILMTRTTQVYPSHVWVTFGDTCTETQEWIKVFLVTWPNLLSNQHLLYIYFLWPSFIPVSERERNKLDFSRVSQKIRDKRNSWSMKDRILLSYYSENILSLESKTKRSSSTEYYSFILSWNWIKTSKSFQTLSLNLASNTIRKKGPTLKILRHLLDDTTHFFLWNGFAATFTFRREMVVSWKYLSAIAKQVYQHMFVAEAKVIDEKSPPTIVSWTRKQFHQVSLTCFVVDYKEYPERHEKKDETI